MPLAAHAAGAYDSSGFRVKGSSLFWGLGLYWDNGNLEMEATIKKGLGFRVLRFQCESHLPSIPMSSEVDSRV